MSTSDTALSLLHNFVIKEFTALMVSLSSVVCWPLFLLGSTVYIPIFECGNFDLTHATARVTLRFTSSGSLRLCVM